MRPAKACGNPPHRTRHVQTPKTLFHFEIRHVVCHLRFSPVQDAAEIDLSKSGFNKSNLVLVYHMPNPLTHGRVGVLRL